MNEPNFFIIGAPKCGTTSLAHWLGQHPEVFVSPVKEPHHFSVDFPLRAWADRLDYLSLFEDASAGHKAVGEASVWYLRSSQAVPRIEESISDPRYIVMLRNPVEMAPSLHWQAFYTGDETIRDFAQAWREQADREAGNKIPRSARIVDLVRYRLACRLGEQLSRLYQTVERDRVLTVFLDDLQSDVRQEWARVLAFLGVSYWDDLAFYPENRSKHWRWPWVRDLQRFYSDTRKRLNLPPLGWGVFDRLGRVAVQEARREPLSSDLRRELVETFCDDIDLLAELTGRNLEHWKA